MIRDVLKNGTTLFLAEYAGNPETAYMIDGCIGRGASSLVYQAHFTDGHGSEHKVRIKECCPDGKATHGEDCTVVWENESVKQKTLKRFAEAYYLQSKLHNSEDLGNTTVEPDRLCEKNNTMYLVMRVDYGLTMDKMKAGTLEEILAESSALLRTIGIYHSHGYLHLDIKPENILVLNETHELVKLFDMDSVIKEADVATNKNAACSYSPGWAAPEQFPGSNLPITAQTDLFAIAAVLFWRLTGKKVEAEDCTVYAEWDFAEPIFDKVNPCIKEILTNFFHKALCASPKYRYCTAEEMLTDLNKAMRVARSGSPYLVDNGPCGDAFLGRNAELKKIEAEYAIGKRVVFVSGFGGIGKSALAIQYGQQNKGIGKKYNTVVFCQYSTGTSLKGCISQLPVQNCDVTAENIEQKLAVITGCLDSKTLLILDNYDVDLEDAEDIGLILNLKSDVLITTRTDFSDICGEEIGQYCLETMDRVSQTKLFENQSDHEVDEEELNDLYAILDAVNGHTLTVKLLARQLKESAISIKELHQNLFGYAEKVNYRKDEKIYAQTVPEALNAAFKMADLNEDQRQVLRNMWVLNGIHHGKAQYREWTMSKSLEPLNTMIRLGWVEYDKQKDKLSLHPLVAQMLDIETNPLNKNLGEYRIRPLRTNCAGLVSYASKEPNSPYSDTENYADPRVAMQVWTRLCVNDSDDADINKFFTCVVAPQFLETVKNYYDCEECDFIENAFNYDFSPVDAFEPWLKPCFQWNDRNKVQLYSLYLICMIGYEDMYGWEPQDKQFYALRCKIDEIAGELCSSIKEVTYISKSIIIEICDYIFTPGTVSCIPNTPNLYQLFRICYETMRKELIANVKSNQNLEPALKDLLRRMSEMVYILEKSFDDSGLQLLTILLDVQQLQWAQLLFYELPEFPHDFAWDHA